MTEESPIIAPKELLQIQTSPVTDAPLPKEPTPPPSLDEIRAVDEAFTANREPDLGAELLVLWASGPLLIELAKEHFVKEETGEEPDERSKDG